MNFKVRGLLTRGAQYGGHRHGGMQFAVHAHPGIPSALGSSQMC